MEASSSYRPPARFNFVRDVVEPLAEKRGDETALIALCESGVKDRLSFADIARRAEDYGNVLAHAGARQGTTVLMMIGSTPEWVETMLGTWRIGAVALPCSEMLRSKDLALRLEMVEPAVVVTAECHLDEIRNAIAATETTPTVLVTGQEKPDLHEVPTAPTADTAIDDPALLIFTSGTTGEPRPATHIQRYLWGQTVQGRHWLDARPGDTLWCTAATGWSKSSRNTFVAPWLCGAAAVVHSDRFDPETRMMLAAEAKVTILCQAPTEYRLIAKRGEIGKRGSLRHLTSAGEPLNPEVIRAFQEATGLGIYDSYGQTETGALTAMPPGEPVRMGSMGKPLPGFKLEVRDDELVVYTPSVPTAFAGYANDSAGVADWYHTGDRVHQDSDGYLWFEGRTDDVIISSGYRIGPFEVESALVEHPGVAEAAAIGVPDPDRGSIVKAYVVVRGAVEIERLADRLKEHVKQSTAPYKYPREIEFIDELPKTASGKIRRSELRSRAQAAPSKPAS